MQITQTFPLPAPNYPISVPSQPAPPPQQLEAWQVSIIDGLPTWRERYHWREKKYPLHQKRGQTSETWFDISTELNLVIKLTSYYYLLP